MSIAKLLIGVGIGVAGKWLYDQLQEQNTTSKWDDEDEDEDEVESSYAHNEAASDLSATMDTQTNEVTQNTANPITDTLTVQPAA